MPRITVFDDESHVSMQYLRREPYSLADWLADCLTAMHTQLLQIESFQMKSRLVIPKFVLFFEIFIEFT